MAAVKKALEVNLLKPWHETVKLEEERSVE